MVPFTSYLKGGCTVSAVPLSTWKAGTRTPPNEQK